MELKDSLSDYLEKISKKRKKARASEKEIKEANGFIWGSKKPEELIVSFENLEIHGSFKVEIMKKLKKDHPEYFKTK